MNQPTEQNIRIDPHISIRGPVYLIVGGLSSLLLLFIVGLFTFTHFQQAVLLAQVVVYGGIALAFLAALGLVAALWIRFVWGPWAQASAQVIAARGQDSRNRLIHAQPNAIVYQTETGDLSVVPLLAAPRVEVSEVAEPEDDASGQEPDHWRILELAGKGMALRDIALACNTTYYKVQKITSAWNEKLGKVG